MGDPKIHKVRSRTDSNTIYEVAVYPDGSMMCDCIYFCKKGWRQMDCAHIRFIRDKYYTKAE